MQVTFNANYKNIVSEFRKMWENEFTSNEMEVNEHLIFMFKPIILVFSFDLIVVDFLELNGL